jgi:hypothetical protein
MAAVYPPVTHGELWEYHPVDSVSSLPGPGEYVLVSLRNFGTGLFLRRYKDDEGSTLFADGAESDISSLWQVYNFGNGYFGIAVNKNPGPHRRWISVNRVQQGFPYTPVLGLTSEEFFTDFPDFDGQRVRHYYFVSV